MAGGNTGAAVSNLSVVVPALNEACTIRETLELVRRLPGIAEIIVVDSGSSDGTADLARAQGAFVVRSPRGRGRQLQTGAAAARGGVLWFLHADTHPPADAADLIQAALADPRVVGGCFRVRFDRPDFASRFFTWFYGCAQCCGLRYGDSAYFIRREAYERSGGFRPWPIFEDLDLLRRLRRQGRFVRLPSRVVTSSRRFEGRSATGMLLRWSLLQVLYWMGVPPTALGRLYAAVRGRPSKSRSEPGTGTEDPSRRISGSGP